jgi:hypothetical protein
VGLQTIGGLIALSHKGWIRPSTHWQVQTAFAAVPPSSRSMSATKIVGMRTS